MATFEDRYAIEQARNEQMRSEALATQQQADAMAQEEAIMRGQMRQAEAEAAMNGAYRTPAQQPQQAPRLPGMHNPTPDLNGGVQAPNVGRPTLGNPTPNLSMDGVTEAISNAYHWLVD